MTTNLLTFQQDPKMTDLLTFQQVLDTTREVVAERPDHHDQIHRFAGERGCLAGVVLHRMGLTTNLLGSHTPGSLIHYSGVPVEEGVVPFLDLVMMLNDQGARWSKVLADAEKFAIQHGLIVTVEVVPKKQAPKVTIDSKESLKFFKAITTPAVIPSHIFTWMQEKISA